MVWSLIQHTTDYMRRPRLGDKKPPTLWPSEASALITNKHGEEEVVGKCRRALFLRYMMDSYSFFEKYSFYEPLVTAVKQAAVPTDQYMLWIWRAGELYEEHCVNLAKESGVWIASQIQVFVPPLNLSGKIDLVAINPDTGNLTISEIKSVYGHNANHVLGTPGERRNGESGTPKDSNLMQIALYDWFVGKRDSQFEDSRLTYGARDTGRFAEYLVRTEENQDGVIEINYRGIAPTTTPWVKSPITITSIVEQYQYVASCLENGTVPPRDYDAQYSDEKIDQLYDRGELSKADSERVAKRREQIAQGKTKINMQIKKGDWQCNYCNFSKLCYDEDGVPRNL